MKRVVFLASALSLSSVSPRAEGADVSLLLQRGVQAFREERFPDAVRDLSAVLWEDPGNVAARNYLWNIAQKAREEEKDYRLTDDQLAAAVRLAEDQLSARARESRETLKGLKEAYRRSKSPQSPEQMLSGMEGVEKYLGVQFDSARDATQAEAYFQDILRKLSAALTRGDFATHKDQWNAEAFLAYYQGRWEEAASLWGKSLKEDPKDAQVKRNLENVRRIVDKRQRDEKVQDLERQAATYEREGDFEEAVSLWQELVRLDPEHPEAPRRLAASVDSLQRQRRQKKVARLLKDGLSLYRGDNYIEAAQVWLEALQLDPSNQEIRDWLSRSGQKLERNKPEPARSAAVPRQDAAAKGSPSAVSSAGAEAAYAEGLQLYAQGDSNNAILLWKKALQMDPSLGKAKKALEYAEAEINLQRR